MKRLTGVRGEAERRQQGAVPSRNLLFGGNEAWIERDVIFGEVLCADELAVPIDIDTGCFCALFDGAQSLTNEAKLVAVHGFNLNE